MVPANKLWKGRRDSALELNVIDQVAVRWRASRWEVFERLDSTFEQIAAEVAERIQGSISEQTRTVQSQFPKYGVMGNFANARSPMYRTCR